MQPTAVTPDISDIYRADGSSYGGANPLANIYAPSSGQQGQPEQPQQPAAPKPKGNWLTHLLPFAGSLGGGAAGAAAGAAAGSFIPIIGTGIGGILGGILGATAGGGGAKAAENLAEGSNVGEGVGTAALESGVGQALGGVAGKVLGKGAQYLTNRASGITKAATDTAAAKAAQDAEVATAQATRNNFGGVRPSVQSANNLDANQKLLQQWGLDHTSPEVMQNASKGGLFINDIDQAALAAGKPIRTTDLISSRDITNATPEEQMALASPKVGVISPDGKMAATVTPQQAHAFAQELNGQMRDLQALADNAKAAGNVSDYKMAKQQLTELTNKYNSVQTLASTPEVNAAVAARMITPEEKAMLVEQFGQKQADHIEQAVNSAQSHQDLVTAKLPFAQMNDASHLALKDMQASGTSRALARAKTDINGDGVADATAPVQPSPGEAGLNIIAGGHTNPITLLGRAIYHTKDNPGILNGVASVTNAASRMAPLAGAGLGAANAQIQSGGTMGEDMQPTAMEQPDALAPAVTPGGPAGGLSRDDLITLALYSPQAFSGILSAAQPQQQQVIAANQASTALEGLGNAPGGGILSQVTGKLGFGPTGEYQRKAESAAQQVSAALPGTDAKAIERQLTDYAAGGGNIDEAIQALLQRLSSVVNNNRNGAYQQLMNYGG